MKLPTASEMQGLDLAASQDFHIPSIVLMENAGLKTVIMAEQELGKARGFFASIFIGPGNNGGDGLVIARHLYQQDCQVILFLLVEPKTFTGDTATNFKIVEALKIPYHIVDNAARVEMVPVLLKQFEAKGLPCYAIFDAIFGIGLSREVTGHFAKAIDLINSPIFKGKAPVIAVDLPSGMDADKGSNHGPVVRADFTATYGCAKPAHFINGKAAWSGKLEIIDIGIPPQALAAADIKTEVSTLENISRKSFWLCRKKNCHKGDNGHLLVLAGSQGKAGAALLAARGALRAGTGLVTLAAPSHLQPIYQQGLPEAMTLLLKESSGFFKNVDYPQLFEFSKKIKAMVIGPGIGFDPETISLVLSIYQNFEIPLVLDADAITILAKEKIALGDCAGPRIFTPHPGELSRVLNMSAAAINDNRLAAVDEGIEIFANDRHETVLLLKGPGTLIASNKGKRHINTTGNPGMACAGMGDVLSGIIAGLICQGFPPLDAAVTGAYLHGHAADLLYAGGASGYTASEVADTLPRSRLAIIEEVMLTR